MFANFRDKVRLKQQQVLFIIKNFHEQFNRVGRRFNVLDAVTSCLNDL